MRLNRYLSLCGLGSRRKCEALIRAGRVGINGRRVQVLATQIQASDTVSVDGRVVQPADKAVYVLLNKPAGVITSVRDERQRRTVMDLVDLEERVFPVGRLDKDTEGLLLLTNDGELAYRLSHPSFEIDKVYRVQINRRLEARDKRRIEAGVVLDGRRTSTARLQSLADDGRNWLVTIHEGRKRQVRRMFAMMDYEVTYLCREQLGPLRLGNLAVGAWRLLAKDEVARLKHAVELDHGNP